MKVMNHKLMNHKLNEPQIKCHEGNEPQINLHCIFICVAFKLHI